jgi:hypothetical protein
MNMQKAGEIAGRVARALTPDIRDALVFGGIGMAAYGISLLSLPASLVFAGLMLFYLGIR